MHAYYTNKAAAPAGATRVPRHAQGLTHPVPLGQVKNRPLKPEAGETPDTLKRFKHLYQDVKSALIPPDSGG